MKEFMKRKGWRLCYAGYILIYMPWFMLIEKMYTMDYPGLHIINIPLDDRIPFCEYFAIPYYIWFFYVAAGCVLMYLIATNKEFLQYVWALMIGMTLFLVISMIYPNGITLRPDYVPDNFCGNLLKGLYVVDTSTNVFPSIHVYNSLVVNAAILKCEALKKHYVVKIFSTIICISICLSTMFLKQHSIVDVVGAIVMFIVLYIAIYVVKYKKIKKDN